jgi:hypothetical protein
LKDFKFEIVSANFKTFVLSMSGFLLRPSHLSGTKLDELDRFFRKLIMPKIGGLPLIRKVF